MLNEITRLVLGWLLLVAIAFADLPPQGNSQIKIWAQSLGDDSVVSPHDLERDFWALCQSATVRIVKTDSAGSGVIIARQGNTYSVLTNWHVVDSSNPVILTVDDQQHQLLTAPQQLGNLDLALLQFTSEVAYPVAPVARSLPQVGDQVYAAGFPLEISDADSIDLGNDAFRLTQGQVSIIPSKSLPQGYQLGYTNDTAIGMSGSPIFNTEGSLVAIHGRGKYRDPSFGVYIFEDGSEPPPEQLEQMIQSSWGIPLSTYNDSLLSEVYLGENY